MIKKLRKTLLKKYDYELADHKICREETKNSKIIFLSLILFLVVVAIYFTIELFSFIVLSFAFFILVLIPLAFRKSGKNEAYIITPELLIQKTEKNKFIVIAFDNIKKFGTNKSVVVISDIENSIDLDPLFLAKDMLVIIDILEAKGKTFDKSKDYMVRPIEIIIKDNDVMIKDIKLDETSTETLTVENSKDYSSLTPGFLDEIILMNSVVDSCHNKDNNLYFNIGSFEVSTGHPENTMFDSQIANDCLMIFEDVEILSIIKKQARGKKERVIESSLDNLCVELSSGVISDWKHKANKIEIQFSVGLYIVKTSFEYKEVILGWNNFNTSVDLVEPKTKVISKIAKQEIEEEHIPLATEEFQVLEEEPIVTAVVVETPEAIVEPVVVETPEPIEEPVSVEPVIEEIKVVEPQLTPEDNTEIDPIVDEKPVKTKEVKSDDSVSAYLSKMKVADLRAMAKVKKIAGYSKLNKTQLVEALK